MWRLCQEMQDPSLALGQNLRLEDVWPLGPGLQEQDLTADTGDKVASCLPEPGSDGAQEERKWSLTRGRGTDGAGPGLLRSLRPKVRGHLELSLRSRLADSGVEREEIDNPELSVWVQ